MNGLIQAGQRRLVAGQQPWREQRLDDAAADDLVIEKDGQRVLVDSDSLPFLANAMIDFSDALIGARFVVENPNASSSCGCGTSFSL